MTRRDKDLDHEYRMRLVQAFSTGWQSLMRFGCFGAICLCTYLCVRQLAGQHTWADVQFKVLADLQANKYFGLILPWSLVGLAGFWAGGERYFRKRHIKRVSSEGSEMQKHIDAGRRSSQLSKKGDTNPEDF